MPDDNLFPSEGEPNTLETLPEGTTPHVSPPLSHADLTSIIEQFVQPNTDQMVRITRTQESLSNAIQAIADRVDLGNGNGEASRDGEIDVSDFLSDPARHIAEISRGVVGTQVREQVGPLLAQLVQQTHNSTIKAQESAVDAEFGVGAWKTHFWPELKPIFDRTQREAPSQLGNVEAIQRAVDTVKGMKFEPLAKARESALKSGVERGEAEQNALLEIVRSNLTGGITRASGKAVLTEDMKEYIEREFRATGVKPDESSFMASVSSGSTLSDWQEAQDAIKKAKGKG